VPPKFRKAENAGNRKNKLNRKVGVEYQQADANHGEIHERNVPDTLISLRDHPASRDHVANIEMVICNVVKDERVRIAHEAENHWQAAWERSSQDTTALRKAAPGFPEFLAEHGEKNREYHETVERARRNASSEREAAGYEPSKPPG